MGGRDRAGGTAGLPGRGARYQVWLAGMALVLAAAGFDAAAAELRVTEVHGGARQAGRALQLLDTLQGGGNIELAAGGLLIVWDKDSGRRFVAAGPGRFSIGAAGPELLAGSGSVHAIQPRGAAPATQRPPGGGAPSDIMAGAVMRATATAIPAAGAAAVSAAPGWHETEFNWRNRAHTGDWHFRLFGPEGDLLHEARVADHRYRLPPAMRLQPGGNYRWEVVWNDYQAVDQRESKRFRAAGSSAAERIALAIGLRDDGDAAGARAMAPELFDMAGEP